MEKIFTYQIDYNGTDEFNQIQFCAKNIIEAKNLYFDWCRTDMHKDIPWEITNIKVVYNADDAKEYGSEYGTPDDYAKFKEPEAKIFRIPMEWVVWQKINVKAHTPEEAIAFVKNQIENIPLGTEPNYIEGTHMISGDDGKSVAELVEDLTKYWALDNTLSLEQYPYANDKETPSCV